MITLSILPLLIMAAIQPLRHYAAIFTHYFAFTPFSLLPLTILRLSLINISDIHIAIDIIFIIDCHFHYFITAAATIIFIAAVFVLRISDTPPAPVAAADSATMLRVLSLYCLPAFCHAGFAAARRWLCHAAGATPPPLSLLPHYFG
jgi:hypothetical protein